MGAVLDPDQGRVRDPVLTPHLAIDFVAGLGAVFGLGFGLGSLLLGSTPWGVGLLSAAAVSTGVLYLRHGRSPGPSTPS